MVWLALDAFLTIFLVFPVRKPPTRLDLHGVKNVDTRQGFTDTLLTGLYFTGQTHCHSHGPLKAQLVANDYWSSFSRHSWTVRSWGPLTKVNQENSTEELQLYLEDWQIHVQDSMTGSMDFLMTATSQKWGGKVTVDFRTQIFRTKSFEKVS